MAGCPGECVYCDQRRTADPGEVPSPAAVTAALDRDLESAGPWTVAFYGGTFTGLPLDTIDAYLDAVRASRYADVIDGVRISTRPDMLNDDVLAILTAGRVKTTAGRVKTASSPSTTRFYGRLIEVIPPAKRPTRAPRLKTPV
jgi:radical SAM superfamily enzyme